MARPHRFQPRKKTQQPAEWKPTELPLWASVGVYARQSTQMQVRVAVNSTEMQTDDLVEFARRLGWHDEQIILFTQDLGRSGRLRIDEREGLRTLVSYIEEGTIKAVIVFLEDRLFRDETQIQVNTFIALCKEQQVLVITPTMTYNFHNRFHVKEFRWKCEAAADYITDYVMSRLVASKYKVSERGEYDGRAVPTGFILDRREWIESKGIKEKNAGYKRYLVYEPHAEVVRWLYHRYMMLGGNFNRLCREVQAKPVLFPDFTPDVDPRNSSKLELRRVEGGYHVTRRGLISILTNVSYLGWWVHQGEVKIKGNHPAIVEEDMFWYAFNRLSEYTPEGIPNEHRKRYAPRYERQAGVNALLKQSISTDQGGAVYVVPAGQPPKRKWFYAIHDKDMSLVITYHTAILVSDLDSIFVEKLLKRLKQEDFAQYRAYATREQQQMDAEQVALEEQIHGIDQRCQGIILSLQKPTLSGILRDTLETLYEQLQQQRATLVHTLETTRRTQTRELLEYRQLVQKLAPHWDALAFEDRRSLVEAVTERVVIDSMASHWMRLIIVWRDPEWGRDQGYIWRRYGSSPSWTAEENAIITTRYENEDRQSIQERLPTRSWSAIRCQASLLGIARRKRLPNTSPLPKNLSFADWQFMQEHAIAYTASWGRKEVVWLAEK